MQTRISPVADLPTLSERYGIPAREIENYFAAAVERREMPDPWEFQGVRLWHLDDTDAWYSRYLRAEHEVRQSDLAFALDVSASALSKWERGGGIPRYLVPKLRRIIEEIAASREAA